MDEIQLRVKAAPSAGLLPIDPFTATRALLAVFQTSSIGMAILNRNLCFVGVNPALAKMHGVPATAHPGREISHVAGKAAVTVASLITRVFETGQPIKGVKVSAKLSSRTQKIQWVEDYLPLTDSMGKVNNVVVLAVEISQFAQKRRTPSPPPPTNINLGPGILSPREAQIVRFLAEGKSTKEVSSVLGISTKTVESHRSRALLKLHLDSLVELVHYAIRTNLVEA